MAFDYVVNPYRGCEFGCVYCYARYTHEFMELHPWELFERRIFIKRNACQALLSDMRRRDLTGRWIAIGAATDPYQPVERRERITRSILELLNTRRNLHVSITTKSDLVTRDLDILQQISQHSRLHVNMTVTTPHYEISRKTEPRAPRPDKRLDAVRRLREGGIKAGVFLMPLLPHINDIPADLELLVRMAADAGAAYFATNVLYLRQCSRKRFFPFIEEQFPHLVWDYRRLYSRAGAAELREYTDRAVAEVQRLKEKYGLIGFRRGIPEADFTPDQLALLVDD